MAEYLLKQQAEIDDPLAASRSILHARYPHIDPEIFNSLLDKLAEAVLAETDAAGRDQAQAAIRQAFDDQGGETQRFTFDVSCGGGDCHAPGAVITVTVWSGVDLPLLPAVLGGDAPSFRLDATHTVPVGQFRDLG